MDQSAVTLETVLSIMIHMDPDTFNAAAKGNIEHFKELVKDQHVELDKLVTPTFHDTILHIYIKFDKEETTGSAKFGKQILEMCPSLLLQVNKEGDTPLHVAEKCGNSSIVKLLIECAKAENVEIDLESGLRHEWEMLKMTNNDKNTALHEAVKHDSFDVVKILTKEGDPDFSYSANNLGESPLYLAAAAGYGRMVIQILKSCTSPTHEGPNGKTVLQEAVLQCDLDAVKKILEKKKSLTKNTDQHGWTPLHYAAYYDKFYKVELLLQSDRSAAYLGDNDRKMTPLHMAASQGHLRAIEKIIFDCPECYELEDSRGWNVLHFAMINLSKTELKYLLNNTLIRSLISKKDAKGNTSLHVLAATHPRFAFHYGNFNVSSYGNCYELEKEIQDLSKDKGTEQQYQHGVIRMREYYNNKVDQYKETRVTFGSCYTYSNCDLRCSFHLSWWL